MRKWIIAIVVVILLGGGAFAVMSGGLMGGAAKATPTPAPVVKAKDTVVADAKVVPVRSAALSAVTGGVVAKILVAEGEQVAAGQPVIQLENSRQQAAVAQAEAGLKRAQANLEQVKAGARPQEIAAAQAAVDAAEAQVARIRQGPRADEIAAAEAALAAAQAALKKTLDGPDQATITAARGDLANAEANLKQAQAAYDKIAYLPDAEARPEALRLEQATNSYLAAKARLDTLLQPPAESAVAAARAQVQQAQAVVDKLKAGAQPADLAAAEADTRRARAQLQLLQSGARPEAVAAAEADVANARAALEQAKVALLDTELRAPFAGTVVSIEVNPGELVGPGAPAVRIADVSGWQFETTDLTELDVVRIKVGDPATISLDAIPGLELKGKVAKVKSLGLTRQGDITYTVTVVPDKPDERLRWNMTAAVTIEPAR